MDTYLWIKLAVVAALSATVASQGLEIPDFPEGPVTLTCETYDCPPTAKCVEGDGYVYCDCPPGKTGENCTMDDPCLPVKNCTKGMKCFGPCNPNVVCEGATGLAHCRGCVAGFTGPKCTQDQDECKEFDVCMNGGTCTNTFGDFSCKCTTGWTGKQCNCKKGDSCDSADKTPEDIREGDSKGGKGDAVAVRSATTWMLTAMILQATSLAILL